MKYVIFLASNDNDALSNFKNLADYRRDTPLIDQPHFSRLEYDNKLKVLKKEAFNFLKNPKISSETIEVEFIAHGHPFISGVLLIQAELSSQNASLLDMRPMIEVTPSMVAEFFNQFRNQAGDYNFIRLTLYCCSSLKFGRDLSEQMPNMEIICFNQNISINASGEVYPYSDKPGEGGKAIDRYGNLVEKYSDQHEQAIPYLVITTNNFTKVVALPPELNKNTVPVSTRTAQSPTEILSASKPIIRGDIYRHYRSKSLDSSLPRERAASNLSESTENTKSHQSLPATPRRR